MSGTGNNLDDKGTSSEQGRHITINDVTSYQSDEKPEDLDNIRGTDIQLTDPHFSPYQVVDNTLAYLENSVASEEAVNAVGSALVTDRRVIPYLSQHDAANSKQVEDRTDTAATTLARLSTDVPETNNDAYLSDEGEELDLEFPLYLEELKSEIMQKVIAMSGVRALEERKDSSENICRICYDDSDDGRHPAITMCNCRGSVGLVHVHCLEKWLNQKTTDTCELCQHKFNTKFKATEPNILRSMLKFVFLTDRSRTFPAPSCFVFFLQVLIITFLLATFNMLAFSFVNMLASQHRQESIYTQYTSNLCILMLIIMINWLFSTLLIREMLTQYWVWYHWWLKTFTVKLILSTNTHAD